MCYIFSIWKQKLIYTTGLALIVESILGQTLREKSVAQRNAEKKTMQ